MRQVIVTAHGGPEKLTVREMQPGEPGLRAVRIVVKFAGINFADVVARMGLYPGMKAPFVPGFEVSGVIDAIGPGVDMRVGERVLTMLPHGGYSDSVVVPVDSAIRVPDAMSLEEAAALPVNYLTAYEMIIRFAHLARGERVLIHTAAGGVGIAAIQIARHIGAEIFGTASASKHELLGELGVAHPVDYRNADFRKEIERIGGERAIDVILDPLGGKATKKNYELLASGGRLIVFGFSRAVTGWRRSLRALPELLAMPRLNPLRMMPRNTMVGGFHLARVPAAHIREDTAALFRLHAEGAVRPRIGRVFPLEEAAEAHRYMQGRTGVGKILLSTS